MVSDEAFHQIKVNSALKNSLSSSKCALQPHQTRTHALSLLIAGIATAWRVPMLVCSLSFWVYCRPVLAQDLPYLVADVHPDSGISNGDSRPWSYIEFQDQIYFAASDLEHGRELWKTDGTSEGTVLAADLLPGPEGSSPNRLKVYNGLLMVSTINDGLWRYDGTQAGTYKIYDETPRFLRAKNDLLYFTYQEVIDQGDSFITLFRTDGTVEGTFSIDWLQSYGDDCEAGEFITFSDLNGKLIYGKWIGVDCGRGDLFRTVEIKVSDGSREGTHVIHSITLEYLYHVFFGQGKVVGDEFFYIWRETLDGPQQIWKTDGTSEGVQRIADLPIDRSLIRFAQYVSNGYMFFEMSNALTFARELWRTDGTEAGTILLESFETPGLKRLLHETDFNDNLYFLLAGRIDQGRFDRGSSLWRSDGTPDGTVMVKELDRTDWLMSAYGRLYLWRDLGTHNELWVSDGTAAGTVLVNRLERPVMYHREPDWTRYPPGQFSIEPDGAILFTNVPNPDACQNITARRTGRELWRYDPQTGSSHLLKDIYDDGGPETAELDYLTSVHGLLFFRADDGEHGRELWVSDGSEAGTRMVSDLWPGPEGANPKKLTEAGGRLYFRADHPDLGNEPWTSDGAEAGTRMIKDIVPGPEHSYPKNFAAVGETVFFSASDPEKGRELWMTDGTEAGTRRVKNIKSGSGASSPEWLTPAGDVLYFTADDGDDGREPWRSDGTRSGTRQVKDIAKGSDGSDPAWLTAAGDTLYFGVIEETVGWELWRSDGNEDGTRPIAFIPDLLADEERGELAVLDGEVYFAGHDPQRGRELWKSDGTAEGTGLLIDINAAPGVGSGPRSLTRVGGLLYFTADDGVHGEELWRTDGTESGTFRIADTQPEATAGPPRDLVGVGEVLYFLDACGNLWLSRGIESTTHLVAGVAMTGARPLEPVAQLVSAGDRLFYIADHENYGSESWAYRIRSNTVGKDWLRHAGGP